VDVGITLLVKIDLDGSEICNLRSAIARTGLEDQSSLCSRAGRVNL
jgi:hypothetical protein